MELLPKVHSVSTERLPLGLLFPVASPDLKNIDGIGPSLIKNLVNEKELAFMSRELAKISADLELNVEVENLNFEMDKVRLYKLFKEFWHFPRCDRRLYPA